MMSGFRVQVPEPDLDNQKIDRNHRPENRHSGKRMMDDE